MATNSGIVNAVNAGNADIKGHVGTGPNGSVAIGSNGAIGDKAWVESGHTGIMPGWATDDMHTEILDVAEPAFPTGYSTPAGQTLDNVSYDYVLDHSGDYKLANFTGKVLVSTNVSATLWVTDTFSFGPNDYILDSSPLDVPPTASHGSCG